MLLRRLGLAGIGTDEAARQECVDPGYAGSADARPHHPEARTLGGERTGLVGQLHFGDDAGAVIRQIDGGHFTDHHAAVLDLGFVRHQAFAGIERDGDDRAFLHPVANYQRGSYENRQDRHDPHQ